MKSVREERQQVLEAKAKQAAKEAIDKFEQEWKPLMEAVKEAAETFDNLEGGCCAWSPSFLSSLSAREGCVTLVILLVAWKGSASNSW